MNCLNTEKKYLLFIVFIMFIATLNLSACKNNKESTVSYQNSTVSNEVEKNETGVNIDGSIISWANMKIDNPDLNLTEDQIQVLKYFDVDYLNVSEYNSLQKYPEIFRNAQISINGLVIKMLETNDSTYQCLVWMNGNPGIGDECVQPTNNEFFVATGKHPENGRITEGDWLQWYGRYQDVKNYTINGNKSYYPSLSVNYTVKCNQAGTEERFDLSEIQKVAKAILGENIKIKEPIYGEDFTLDELHYPQYKFYLVTPDNQSNANFSKFEFSQMNGFIRDANSTLEEERRFFVSADFQHYIITVYERNLKLMYLEYYDRDYNKLWSREFQNVDNAVLDYTSETIYLVADNDLYMIDAKNGEDISQPVLVGEKTTINVVQDGIIMVGKGNKDNIMKTDINGNIIWKTSADIEITNCGGLQIIDGTIVANLVQSERNDNEYTYISKMVAIDSNGNIISEFIDAKYP